MATLRSLSNLNGSARGAAALGILLERSSMLRFMEAENAFERDATSFDYLPVDGTGNLQTRAVGGAFTATAKTPPSRVTGALAIYGDAITIDRTHQADAAAGLRDLDTWIEREAARRVRQTGGALDTAIMTGAGTGTTMKGLSVVINGTDIPGFTGQTGLVNATTFTGAGTSFDMSATGVATAAIQDAFIEGLVKVMIDVPDASAIVCNRTLAGRISTVARRAHILGEGRDLFGRPVATFNGVPIVVVSDTAITNAEPDSAGSPANITTSLYVVRPGEGSLSLVTNEGLYYREWEHMESKESSKEEYEIRLAWKVADPDAIRRVRNIKV